MREVFPSHVDKDHCNKEGCPNGVYSHKDVAELCEKIPQIIESCILHVPHPGMFVVFTAVFPQKPVLKANRSFRT